MKYYVDEGARTHDRRTEKTENWEKKKTKETERGDTNINADYPNSTEHSTRSQAISSKDDDFSSVFFVALFLSLFSFFNLHAVCCDRVVHVTANHRLSHYRHYRHIGRMAYALLFTISQVTNASYGCDSSVLGYGRRSICLCIRQWWSLLKPFMMMKYEC